MTKTPKRLRAVDEPDVVDDYDLTLDSDAGSPLSYETVKEGQELESYIDDIADTVRVGLDQSISILTPWFFNNMPRIYYQTTPRQEKVRHLSAIITGHVFETKQTVELWDRDRSKVTYIGPGGDRQILIDMAKKLKTFPIKMGSLYFSRDKLLFLSTFFSCAHRSLDKENQRIIEKIKAARAVMLKEFPDDGEQIDRYLNNLDNDFVIYATARRLHITYGMVRYMMGHEGAHTLIEPFDNSASARLTLGMKNVEPSNVMEIIFHLVHRYDFNIRRAFVVYLRSAIDEPVTIMHLIVESPTKQKIEKDSVPVMRLSKALRTLGWVDVDDYDALSRTPYNLSINAANFIRALGTYIHLSLGKRNPHIYSPYKVQSTFFKHAEETLGLVKLFRIKFDPSRADGRKDDGYRKAFVALSEQIGKMIEEIDLDIFREGLHFIDHILKTNYFLNTKTGLAFRLDPQVLDKRYYPQQPFGIFFVVGRDFRFYQVRWKDISRGGLRVVMPRGGAEYDYALSGLFDEVYGLSMAQQLKNKDIPEGGSKAVLLLKPGGNRDQAVKGAVNALLDLLVSEDESHEGTTAANLVSYMTREEIIYLGPDENITNELINWITAQAERRGYTYHNAFMSSKPGAGINHKEYGVTSEGLNVFVHNMLQFLGIDPKVQKFSIKMTGGPDGDVAGNELKILFREYGENARVVAIADGFGAAYDPDGLKWPELLRLFKEGKAISEFNPKLLSASTESFVIKADNNERIRVRNEVCARKYADIFIPAGGRPYSVNDNNWKTFVGEDGKPTVRAIVEGANIFFTPGAREKLQEQGILQIKDSSANKTGVICSSYEIIASLILAPLEFKKIKERYVKEVIDILRIKADQEAKLLFREYANFDGHKTLVELSLEISKEINEVTDALLEEFGQNQKEMLADGLFQSLVYKHCPPILVDKFRDRILTKMPPAHQIAIVSAYIASYIVYREGLGWLHRIPEGQRYEAAQIYMQKDELANQLIRSVQDSGLKQKQQIVEILRRSAARDLTMLEFENHAAPLLPEP